MTTTICRLEEILGRIAFKYVSVRSFGTSTTVASATYTHIHTHTHTHRLLINTLLVSDTSHAHIIYLNADWWSHTFHHVEKVHSFALVSLGDNQ